KVARGELRAGSRRGLVTGWRLRAGATRRSHSRRPGARLANRALMSSRRSERLGHGFARARYRWDSPALRPVVARAALVCRPAAGSRALRSAVVRPESLLRGPLDGVADTTSRDSTASWGRHAPSAECDGPVRTAVRNLGSDSLCHDAAARAVARVESSG